MRTSGSVNAYPDLIDIGCTSSYLHDRATVRSGAEIGLMSFRLSVSQGASLGDFLLAPACPVEKETLWEGFFYLTSGSETDEGAVKDKVFARAGNRTRGSGTRAQYAIH